MHRPEPLVRTCENGNDDSQRQRGAGRTPPAAVFGLGAALLAGMMAASGPAAPAAGARSGRAAEVAAVTAYSSSGNTTCCGRSS